MRSGSGRRTSSTIWRAWAQASAWDMPSWIIGTSISCVADLHRGVEGGHRLLIDHRDFGAADGAQLVVAHQVEVAALELDRAADDAAVLAEVLHHAERHGGLAAAGLADQAHRLARHHGAGEIHHRRDLAQAGEEARSRGCRSPGSAGTGPRGCFRSCRPPWGGGEAGGAAPGPPGYLGQDESGTGHGAQSLRLSSRSPSASRFRPSTRLISASAGASAGCG